MKIKKTNFEGLKIIEGKKFLDKRGYFRETNKKKYIKNINFIFWCMSKSKKNVLRGLHLQIKEQQDKFISVIKGKILDVVVDLRKNSKTFGKHFRIELSDKNCKSLFIPKGFAHGFLTLDNENIIFYGNSRYRSKKNEVGIIWNDKDLSINWPKKKQLISSKNKKKISIDKNIYFLFTILLLLLFEWFYNHPSLRYGGYVLIATILFLPLSLYLSYFSLNPKRINTSFTVLIIFSFIIFLGRNISRIENEITKYSYRPFLDNSFKISDNHYKLQKNMNYLIDNYKRCNKEKKNCDNKLAIIVDKGLYTYIFKNK